MRFSSLLSRKECVDKQHTENCHSSSARKTQSASPLCSRQAPHSFLQTSQRLPEWIPTDRFQYCAVHLSTADREMRQRRREKQICCAGNVRLTQVEFISTELEGREDRITIFLSRTKWQSTQMRFHYAVEIFMPRCSAFSWKHQVFWWPLCPTQLQGFTLLLNWVIKCSNPFWFNPWRWQYNVTKSYDLRQQTIHQAEHLEWGTPEETSTQWERKCVPGRTKSCLTRFLLLAPKGSRRF